MCTKCIVVNLGVYQMVSPLSDTAVITAFVRISVQDLGNRLWCVMYIRTYSTRNRSVGPKPRYKTDVRRRQADLALPS